MLCKFCGCELHSASPPKRPRHKRADSAAGKDGDLAANIPNMFGFSAVPDHQNSTELASIPYNFMSSGAFSGTTVDHSSASVQSARTSSLLCVSGSQTTPSAVSLPLDTGQGSSFLPSTVASSTVAEIFSETSSWTVAGLRQSQSSSPPVVASVDLVTRTGHCNSSDHFTFSSPISVSCSDCARPGSTENSQLPPESTTHASSGSCTPSTPISSWSSNAAVPTTSSGQILAVHSDLHRSVTDGRCWATSVILNQEPRPTQPLSSMTKASSAPVVGSLKPDRDEDSSKSAPPALFPLVTQPPVTSIATPSQTSPFSITSNQLFSQSSTLCASAEGQSSGSTYSLPLCSPGPVSSSSAQVFGWSPTTNCSSGSASASTQSNYVFDSRLLTDNAASGSQNLSSSFLGASNSTHGTTPSFTGGFGIPSSGTTTLGSSAQSVGSPLPTNNLCSSVLGVSHSTQSSGTIPLFTGGFGIQSSCTTTLGTSTQPFGSPMPANNCTASSASTSISRSSCTYSFLFGNALATHSSMDVGQSLGTPTLTSTNCQTPVTTCWRWYNDDTSSPVSSTLSPSTRSSPFWQTSSSTESNGRFGSSSERQSSPCQSVPVFGVPTTSSQCTTAVDIGGTLPPAGLFQSSCRQQQTIDTRRSSTSVSWASQNTVMSTVDMTVSSQPSPCDEVESMSHSGMFITVSHSFFSAHLMTIF